jgi:hypothetical protein
MSNLVLRVRRGRQLLGAWRLDDEPLEMAIVDEESGKVIGRFTASGGDPEPDTLDTMPAPPVAPPVAPAAPRRGGHDEVPVGTGAHRMDGDDFTMPLPEATEATEPTADLVTDTADTEEAELAARLSRSRPRPIPNLAARGEGEVEVDTLTGLGDLPTQEASQDVIDDADILDEDTGVGRAPDLGAPPPPAPPPHEDDLDLEGLEEEMELDQGRPTTLGGAVAPAEVWVRRQSEWRSGGSLKPGQRAVSRGGWVRLRRDGRLVVRPGPSLSGSATLADGSAVEIDKDVPPVELPAGASVLLRAGEYGLYVRSEAWTGGGLPRLGS